MRRVGEGLNVRRVGEEVKRAQGEEVKRVQGGGEGKMCAGWGRG